MSSQLVGNMSHCSFSSLKIASTNDSETIYIYNVSANYS